MKNVVVVRSSNRPIDEQCAACVANLVNCGATLVSQTGSSDVALQRNESLTRVVNFVRAEPALPFDVVLMVDDDMVFGTRAAGLVIAHCRTTGNVASACYALGNGDVAFERMPGGRYMGGLGFLAIPVATLVSLATRSPVYVDDGGQEFWEFTTTGAELCDDGRRRWRGEDYRLTRALGGVDLLPVAVGHLKSKVVLPDGARFEALTGASRLSSPPSEPTTSPDVGPFPP